MTKKSLLITSFAIVIVLCLVAYAFISQNKNSPKIQSFTNGNYYALGDSVAAGVGLGDYSDSSACDRTVHAYPNIVAKKLNYSLTSMACSGASTTNGLTGPQIVNKLTVKPQLKWLLSQAKPKLISLSIGANDTQWTSLIQKCYTQICGGIEDQQVVNTGLENVKNNLNETIKNIQQKYPNNTPKVVVTDYYNLFSDNPINKCAELSGIDTTELAWIRSLQVSINNTVQTASKKYSFIKFVPISFRNHELCSSIPWIQGISNTMPFHPTNDGQNAIANQIVLALKGK